MGTAMNKNRNAFPELDIIRSEATSFGTVMGDVPFKFGRGLVPRPAGSLISHGFHGQATAKYRSLLKPQFVIGNGSRLEQRYQQR